MSRWRALPVQELYASPERWADALRAWITPRTCVALVTGARAGTASEAWQTPGLAAALPEGRTMLLGHLMPVPPGETPLPVFRGIAQLSLWGAGNDVPGVCETLRKMVQPVARRRIMVVHDAADTALAEALAAALDGRTDAQGRLVEAWCAPASGVYWHLSIASLRRTLQIVLHHLESRHPTARSLWQRAWQGYRRAAMRQAAALWKTPEGAPEAYEAVLLQSAALRASVQRVKLDFEDLSLIAESSRRIGVRLDRVDEPLCRFDAQLPASADAPVTALAAQLLEEAWVALAPASAAQPERAEPPPPAPAPAPGGSRLETIALALQASAQGRSSAVTIDSTEYFPAPVRSLAFVDEARFAAGLADGNVALFPAAGTRPHEAMGSMPGPITAMLSLPGVGIFAGDEQGHVLRWRNGFDEARPFGRHEGGAVRAIAASASWVVSGGDDAAVCYWAIAVPSLLARVALPSAVTGVAVAGDAVFVACRHHGVLRHLLDAAPTAVAPLARGDEVHALCLVDSAICFAGRTADGAGFARRVWPDDYHEPTLCEFPSPVLAMCGPFGDKLLLGCENGSVWLWPGGSGSRGVELLREQGPPVRLLLQSGAWGFWAGSGDTVLTHHRIERAGSPPRDSAAMDAPASSAQPR
jgi:hypothetical protein